MNRDKIMQAFRKDFNRDNELLNSFSHHDKQELILMLCADSDALEMAIMKVLDLYNEGKI